ncbi:legumain-like [Lingula anatina]|uniref:Hemoglobinase n=1 Tax=Lingula anatina TaxID=7574 RepID=A0A1S3J315_LINAN|nr:legumain-like [Lingula anatina]|eukprot:XP_013404249.1 legumain-like [Lingula anatina]
MERVASLLLAVLLISAVKCSILDNEIEQFIKGATTGKHWALIVAGSSGWFNYRHQADVCHAYHVLHSHGIPDERIVVMMYDDIAQNRRNPTPGKIINRPNGPDVYKGVPKDYVGKTVTPENFLSVLQGNKKALGNLGSGKVINSGPNDHIFVNFVDHGGPGVLAFPRGELHAKALNKALNDMYDKKKFAKMVLYIEACESGSMVANLLPKNINVYATTASNPKESSYACFYDKERETYLGDVYSVKWMEDSDKENLQKETLKKQFRIVKEETNTSHVMEYGDLSIAESTVAEFQGGKATPPKEYPPVPLDAVPSPDVPMAILYHRLEAAKTEEQREEIRQEMEKIQLNKDKVMITMKHIAGYATKDHVQAARVLQSQLPLIKHDCYEPVARHFLSECFRVSENEYALRHLYVLVNLCQENVPQETIISAMEKACKKVELPDLHAFHLIGFFVSILNFEYFIICAFLINFILVSLMAMFLSKGLIVLWQIPR